MLRHSPTRVEPVTGIAVKRKDKMLRDFVKFPTLYILADLHDRSRSCLANMSESIMKPAVSRWI